MMAHTSVLSKENKSIEPNANCSCDNFKGSVVKLVARKLLLMPDVIKIKNADFKNIKFLINLLMFIHQQIYILKDKIYQHVVYDFARLCSQLKLVFSVAADNI